MTLRANAFAFLIVAGLAILAMPVYFALVGYDRQLRDLEAKPTDLRSPDMTMPYAQLVMEHSATRAGQPR